MEFYCFYLFKILNAKNDYEMIYGRLISIRSFFFKQLRFSPLFKWNYCFFVHIQFTCLLKSMPCFHLLNLKLGEWTFPRGRSCPCSQRSVTRSKNWQVSQCLQALVHVCEVLETKITCAFAVEEAVTDLVLLMVYKLSLQCLKLL